MRDVTINLATGQNNAVDPRIAPNGTIHRAQNVRVDKEGRLRTRNGYSSLGMTVAGTGIGNLVPFDLHNFNGQLVALGNNNAAQSGIRAAYQFTDTDLGKWHTTAPNNTAAFLRMPAADSVRVVASNLFATVADVTTADIAALASGKFVCMVTSDATQTMLTL